MHHAKKMMHLKTRWGLKTEKPLQEKKFYGFDPSATPVFPVYGKNVGLVSDDTGFDALRGNESR